MFEVKLLIKSEQDEFEFTLDGSITVGRSDEATLVISDSGLSRVHASIQQSDADVLIVDEHSTNGSLVNGREVPPGGTRLKDGDKISIGNHTTITVSIRKLDAARAVAQVYAPTRATAASANTALAGSSSSSHTMLWSLSPPVLAAISAAVIILLAAVALLVAHSSKSSKSVRDAKSTQKRRAQQNVPLLAADISDPDIDGWEVSEPEPKPEEITNVDLRQAVLKVKEDRGEPVGLEARVEIPDELKQYSERGRFLAIQTAEALEQKLRIPHDYPELASMKRDNQFVALAPVGETYVLYATGGGATPDDFTHFDKASGKSVPIFRNSAELQKALGAMTAADESKTFTAAFYESVQARRTMTAEYDALAQLARNFDGRSFDLQNGAARKEFKMRLLSLIRPAARDVMEKLGRAYKEKFNRLLPLTSLIRTEEYQRQLSERNANAARNSLPPHTTGLAFDISYRYMTAAEQNFLMAEIAKMESAGLVEALRENTNNCLHVFAFADGHRPPETLVRRSAG